MLKTDHVSIYAIQQLYMIFVHVIRLTLCIAHTTSTRRRLIRDARRRPPLM